MNPNLPQPLLPESSEVEVNRLEPDLEARLPVSRHAALRSSSVLVTGLQVSQCRYWERSKSSKMKQDSISSHNSVSGALRQYHGLSLTPFAYEGGDLSM